MALSCEMSLIKYLLFIFNLLTSLVGVVLISLGVSFAAKSGELKHILDNGGQTLPLVAIVLGVIVFVISFFGCCGSVKESRCMLQMYAFILLCIIFIQIFVASYSFVNREKISDKVKEDFNNDFDNNQNGTVDVIQAVLQCCGKTGPNDYTLTTLPKSCCASFINTTSICTKTSDDLFKEGCDEELSDRIGVIIKVLGSLFFVFGAVMLAATIFACCLVSSFRQGYEYV